MRCTALYDTQVQCPVIVFRERPRTLFVESLGIDAKKGSDNHAARACDSCF